MEDFGPNFRRGSMERVSRLALGLLLALAFPSAAAASAPSANFTVSPEHPLTLQNVTFTSTSTGDISSQAWDLNNDGFYDNGIDITASRSFPTAGPYYVSLRVRGPQGSGEQTQQIDVIDRAPNASMTWFPSAPEVGTSVTFVSTSHDVDGSIASQAWDLDHDGVFDDGTGAVATRVFPTLGVYIVRLLVTDDNGVQSVAEQAVTVAPKPPEFLRPFPIVRVEGRLTGGGVLISSLRVQAPAGSSVEVRCHGHGCKRHRQKRRIVMRPGPHALKVKQLRFRRFERSLGAQTVLEIFVRKQGSIGKYTRFTIRKGKQPLRRDLCLFPGAKRPASCSS